MNKSDRGVSPVVSIVLLFALTVALVGILSVVLFDITNNTSETPDADVDLIQDSREISVTVLRNENVHSFFIAQEGDELLTEDERISDVGETQTVTESDIEIGDPVQVITITESGDREVLQRMPTTLIS